MKQLDTDTQTLRDTPPGVGFEKKNTRKILCPASLNAGKRNQT